MSFEFQIKQLKLWTYIDKAFILSKEPLLQTDIIDYAIENQIGSKNNVLTMIQQFLDAKMIHELELPPDGPGRPKKAYMRSQGQDEALLVNLGNLPQHLRIYIDEQAQKQQLGKGEILIQLVTWAFLQFQDGFTMQYTPAHLDRKNLQDLMLPRGIH